MFVWLMKALGLYEEPEESGILLINPIRTRAEKEADDAEYLGSMCFHCGLGPEACECLEYKDADVIIRATLFNGEEKDVDAVD